MLKRILPFLLLFTALKSNATTHIVGTPGTMLTLTSTAGIGVGDTMLINAGTYPGGKLGLSNVTYMNYGGQVIFTQNVDLGNSASTMIGVRMTGTGYGGLFYGIRVTGGSLSGGSFGNGGTGYPTGDAITASALHYQRVYFDHLQFDSISVYNADGLCMGQGAITYNGTEGSLKWDSGGMTYCKALFMGKSGLWQGSYYNPSNYLYNNYCRNIEWGYDSLLNPNSGIGADGSYVSGVCFHFNVHDCVGIDNTTYLYVVDDTGLFFFNGSGVCHHNYKQGGRGYIIRDFCEALIGATDTTKIYDNLDMRNRVYTLTNVGSDTLFYGNANTYVTGAACIIAHNTVADGQDDHVPSYTTGLTVISPFRRGFTCLVEGNLIIYGIRGDSITDQSTLNGGTTPTLLYNRYYAIGTSIIPSIIQDTLYTCAPSSGSPINSIVPINIVGIPNVDGHYNTLTSNNSIGWLNYQSGDIVTVGAGSNQTITLPTSSVTLTGTASSSGSTITSTTWSKISGPNTPTIVSPSSLSTSVTGLIAGTYVFQLSATDALSNSNTATVTITVNSATALPPVSNAGSNRNITLPLDSVLLNGSASYSPNVGGSITGYSWSVLSGSGIVITNAAVASTWAYFTPSVTTTYVLQLTVTDNNSNTANSTVTIKVNTAVSGATPRKRKIVINL